MNEIAFKYDESKAPITGYTPVIDRKGKQVDTVISRAVLDGVPMRDLATSDYFKLPKRLQRAVYNAPYFVATEVVASFPDPNKPEPEEDEEPVSDAAAPELFVPDEPGIILEQPKKKK